MESGKRDGNKSENVFPKNSIPSHEGSGCGSGTVGHAGNTVSGITITAGSILMNRAADRKIVK